MSHKQILYQADQNFRTKKLSYLIFSKKSEETFCCSEDKFRGHLIYGGGQRQRVPKSIIWQTEWKNEIRRTINQKLILSSFIYLCQVVMTEHYD